MRRSVPLTGRAGFRLVDPGNIVHASDQTGIVTIVKLQPISVIFTAAGDSLFPPSAALAAGDVPGRALARRQDGAVARAPCPRGQRGRFAASGTIGLKATFQNADEAALAGPVGLDPHADRATLKQVGRLRGRACNRAGRLTPMSWGQDGGWRCARIEVSRTGGSKRRREGGSLARGDGRGRGAIPTTARCGRTGDSDVSLRRRWRSRQGGARAGRRSALRWAPAFPPFRSLPDRDLAADGRACCSSASSPIRSCRSPRCRRSTFPTIQVSALATRRRARRPWPLRSRSRSKGSSRRSPACRR